MIDLNAILGTDVSEMTVDGVTYKLSPKTVSDYAEIEKFILDRRPPVMSILADIPQEAKPDERKRIIEELLAMAMQAPFVTIAEHTEYFRSSTGVAHQLLLAIRPNHPEINTLEQATEIVVKAGFREAQKAASVSRQDDKIKN